MRDIPLDDRDIEFLKRDIHTWEEEARNLSSGPASHYAVVRAQFSTVLLELFKEVRALRRELRGE